MIRCRFEISKKRCGNDYRPITWPIKYPYWCTGENTKNFILVAFVETIDDLFALWPEADHVDSTIVDKIEFSGRFPKPNWYTE